MLEKYGLKTSISQFLIWRMNRVFRKESGDSIYICQKNGLELQNQKAPMIFGNGKENFRKPLKYEKCVLVTSHGDRIVGIIIFILIYF
jgi:hypothetical protein